MEWLINFDEAKYIIGIVVAGALAWAALSARVDSVQAESRVNRETIEEIRKDRAESLKIWQQDRINDAAFRSEVMTKLNRIERNTKEIEF